MMGTRVKHLFMTFHSFFVRLFVLFAFFVGVVDLHPLCIRSSKAQEGKKEKKKKKDFTYSSNQISN